MTEWTDEELAKQLKRLAPVATPRGPLLEAAADRLCTLSAHVALLGASLAQAEREAEKDDDDPTTREEYRNMFHAAVSSLAAISDALGCDPDEGGAEPILAAIKELIAIDAVHAEPFGYFHALPFGWEDCAADSEGAIALYERPAPVVSAEPVAWANFAETGNIRIWTSAAKDAVRIAKENGIRLTPLYTAPQPDRVSELEAEVERLRSTIKSAADDAEYAAFNIFKGKIDGLEAGIVESTDPKTSLLISIRNLRSALSGKEVQS
jgi:hypothetical protein